MLLNGRNRYRPATPPAAAGWCAHDRTRRDLRADGDPRKDFRPPARPGTVSQPLATRRKRRAESASRQGRTHSARCPEPSRRYIVGLSHRPLRKGRYSYGDRFIHCLFVRNHADTFYRFSFPAAPRSGKIDGEERAMCRPANHIPSPAPIGSDRSLVGHPTLISASSTLLEQSTLHDALITQQ